uniref:SCP domain-containing protein n=1 Tax=Mesocestoides corti TaxID=53468 RepID=A0A5K3FI32_MESCO
MKSFILIHCLLFQRWFGQKQMNLDAHGKNAEMNPMQTVPHTTWHVSTNLLVLNQPIVRTKMEPLAANAPWDSPASVISVQRAQSQFQTLPRPLSKFDLQRPQLLPEFRHLG